MALSNTDLGKAMAQESLAIAKQAESPDDTMLALYYCAKAACWTDQHGEKQRAMHESLQIARETGHGWYEAMFLRCETDDVLFLEYITEDQAATYLKAAKQRLSLCEQVGDPALILDTYHLLGVLAWPGCRSQTLLH